MDGACSSAYDLITENDFSIESLLRGCKIKVCGLLVAACMREYRNELMNRDLKEFLGKYKFSNQERDKLYGVTVVNILEGLQRHDELCNFWVLRCAEASDYIRKNYHPCWNSFVTKKEASLAEFSDFVTDLLNMYKEEMLPSNSKVGSLGNDDSSSVSLVEDEIKDSERKQEIITLTEQIMVAINNGDYEGYKKLCDPHLTAIVPKILGNLAGNTDFHKFYFDNVISKNCKSANTKMLNPYVQILCEDAAYISYIRLTQFVDEQGLENSDQSEETRIWQKKDNKWQNIYLHQSTNDYICISGTL